MRLPDGLASLKPFAPLNVERLSGSVNPLLYRIPRSWRWRWKHDDEVAKAIPVHISGFTYRVPKPVAVCCTVNVETVRAVQAGKVEDRSEGRGDTVFSTSRGSEYSWACTGVRGSREEMFEQPHDAGTSDQVERCRSAKMSPQYHRSVMS
jgi:hypothetical protein